MLRVKGQTACRSQDQRVLRSPGPPDALLDTAGACRVEVCSTRSPGRCGPGKTRYPEPAGAVNARGRWPTDILLNREVIDKRVREMGREISRDYEGRLPLLIALLKGGVVFLADLVRELTIDIEIDFISISSYQNRSTSSGSVRLLRDLDRDIYDRDVLIVEDIVDSGLSLSYIHRMLLARGPRSLAIAAFLDKRDCRVNEIEVDYVGYRIPDRFVIGYGLDYQERYRALRSIAAFASGEVPDAERSGP